ncbi:thermonuclease family protein [Pseudoalteromonas sp. SWYJZ19]|uniref:thermonuclease family protein n=1 Tax=Pseudoalteromonas sp. SWYJZ19 TaxID=2792068 RepID=UPI0018CC8E9F|nr:thermonuclease family protein [Pseudoalteromonas sp. SWYJZ19]MBH0050672.1 thermonuclease family protein [Pseudoalteromonas sp. SWYJZ19]
MRLLIVFLLLAFNVNAESIKNKNHGTLIVETVTSIYDGDTFRANIAGLHSLIGERIGIRVAGVDTPEMRGKCKQEKDLARQAKQVTVEALRSAKVIELRNTKRGKYFRIVADVYVDGKNLTDILISSGLGVAYDGGTKAKDWCG